MVHEPKPGWRWAAACAGVLSLGLLAAAADVRPPNAAGPYAGGPADTAAARSAGDSAAAHREITLQEAVLDRYAGTYRLGEKAVLTVKRQGAQLSAQLTAQPAADIFPYAPTEFFYKVVDAQISFVTDGQQAATELILHQNGRDLRAPRVEAAVADQINANLQAKVSSRTPTPGSEAALRQLLLGLVSGKPDYATMSPELAKAMREQLPRLQAALTALGDVQSIEFRGVGNAGWDVYEVRHAHGSSQWRIALSSGGIIMGALFSAGP